MRACTRRYRKIEERRGPIKKVFGVGDEAVRCISTMMKGKRTSVHSVRTELSKYYDVSEFDGKIAS